MKTAGRTRNGPSRQMGSIADQPNARVAHAASMQREMETCEARPSRCAFSSFGLRLSDTDLLAVCVARAVRANPTHCGCATAYRASDEPRRLFQSRSSQTQRRIQRLSRKSGRIWLQLLNAWGCALSSDRQHCPKWRLILLIGCRGTEAADRKISSNIEFRVRSGGGCSEDARSAARATAKRLAPPRP